MSTEYRASCEVLLPVCRNSCSYYVQIEPLVIKHSLEPVPGFGKKISHDIREIFSAPQVKLFPGTYLVKLFS